MKKIFAYLVLIALSYNVFAIRIQIVQPESLLCGDDIISVLHNPYLNEAYKLEEKKVEVKSNTITISYYFNSKITASYSNDTTVLNNYFPTVEEYLNQFNYSENRLYEVVQVIYLDNEFVQNYNIVSIFPFQSCYEVEQQCESIQVVNKLVREVCSSSHTVRNHTFEVDDNQISLIREDTTHSYLVTCKALGYFVESYSYKLENLVEGEYQLTVSGTNVWVSEETTLPITPVGDFSAGYYPSNLGSVTVHKCAITSEIEDIESSVFYPNPVENTLLFDREYNYEIYSLTGVKLLQGFGTTADVSSLIAGSYFLKLDGLSYDFIKK